MEQGWRSCYFQLSGTANHFTASLATQRKLFDLLALANIFISVHGKAMHYVPPL
jgi:hypothetical protein